MSSKAFNYFLLLIIVMCTYVSLCNSTIQIKINDKNLMQLYKDNVYIVDLSIVLNQTFMLTCQDAPDIIDLNFTSNAIKGFSLNISNEERGVPGTRELKFAPKKLVDQHTGLYTCTSLNKNKKIKSLSYYIYFYPNDGTLFVRCLLSQCLLVQYKPKTPFTIPCLTTHPDILVDYKRTNNTNYQFSYKTQIGFHGMFSRAEDTQFTCMARYDRARSEQTHPLDRLEVTMSIESNNSLIHMDNIWNLIKHETYTFTCRVTFKCRYRGFDTELMVNENSNYFISQPTIDARQCANTQTPNRHYIRSITFNRVESNFSFKCSSIFNKEFVFDSAMQYAHVLDRPFIEFNPKNYSNVMYQLTADNNAADIVDIEFFFKASSSIKSTLYFNMKEKVDISDPCLRVSTIEYHCFIQLLEFEREKAGVYTLEVSLENYSNEPSTYLNQTVIAPTKPHLTIARPPHCSLNYTCELNRNISIKCNAYAHQINEVYLSFQACGDLDDCFQMLKTPKFRVSKAIDDELPYNLVWSDTRSLRVDQNYVIFCTSENDLGESTIGVILFASDIENGRLVKVENLGERRDNDTVEGDSMSIRFTYNYQLFDEFEYTHPVDDCEHSVVDSVNPRGLTKSVKLVFPKVSMNCARNYTLTVLSRTHPYLNQTQRSLSYVLRVILAETPSFIQISNLSSNVLTPDSNSNKTNYTSEPDETISFNCVSNGKPNPQVKWLKNNEEIDLSDEKYDLSAQNGLLKVLRVHSSDTGMYKCQVFNRFGSIERLFDLKVNKVELITNKLSKSQVKVIIAIVLLACFLLAALIAALTYVCIQHKKNKRLKRDLKRILELLSDGNDEDLDKETLINTKIENLKKLKFDESRWQIEPTKFLILEKEILGEGEFGKVCKALVSFKSELRTIEDVNDSLRQEQMQQGRNLLRRSFKSKHNPYTAGGTFMSSLKNSQEHEKIPLIKDKDAQLVACKMIKDQKVNSSHLELLVHELKIMGHIGHHLNIIQLVGCHTAQLNIAKCYVFVEFCDNGDLKGWLKKNATKYSLNDDHKKSLIYEHKKNLSRQSSILSESTNKSTTRNQQELPFNNGDLTFFCYQIAKGMEYLAKKRFLHCDLAARNILLGKNYQCKISDFGLADESKLSTQDFYGEVKKNVPVKWTAPEVFKTRRYDAKSDVWSFGITMWEIFNLGVKEPYEDETSKEFVERVTTLGFSNPIIDEPQHGSEVIYQLILDSLVVDSQDRPKFEDLVPRILNLLGDHHKEYYQFLNENFQKQIRESFNRTSRPQLSQQQSESNAKKRLSDDNKKQAKHITTSYLKPLLTNKKQNFEVPKSTNNSYLNPVKENSVAGYLDPKVNESSQNDYYSSSLAGLDVEQVAPQAPPRTNSSLKKQTTFIPNLSSNDGSTLYVDDLDEITDARYLLPRHGSTISSSTIESNNSTSSTAPLSKRTFYSPTTPKILFNKNLYLAPTNETNL